MGWSNRTHEIFVPPRTPRQRALAEWRGIDLEPIEAGRRSAVRPLDQTLDKVLKDMRLDRKRSEAEIVKVWQQAMAPDIVAHAQPVNLAKGTLFIAVDSSVWLSEMVRYRRREILQRLQHSFGKDVIAKLSFRVG